MSRRPVGEVPQWSTDDSYPAGSKPWSGTATKISPELSKLAGGWAPDERPPAQWENYLLNRWSAFLSYLDAIDVKNWQQKTLGLAYDLRGIAVDTNQRRIWAVGRDPGGNASNAKVLSSRDEGYDFVEIGSPITHVITTISIKPGTSTWAGCAEIGLLTPPYGAPSYYVHYNGSTLAEVQLSGYPAASGVCSAYDPYDDVFIIAGSAGAILSGNVAIWTVTHTTPTARTLNTPQADHIIALAVGPTRKVAISSTGLQWDTDAIGNAWTYRGSTPALVNPVDVTYGADDAIFMATCQSSSADTKIFISADGISWILQATILGFQAFGRLVVSGSVWVFLSNFNGARPPAVILYSTDRGKTWLIAGNAPVPGAYTSQVVASMGNRFAIVGSDGAGLSAYSESLKT